ncbi:MULTISPECIES: CrcB family protein [unclassified Corynebacterium]|uniref:CrcB family protein n=1 Tax=unclassified Corynebacterium TaxID=2624378 RepID=UPI001FF05539|nr:MULTISPECIES: CrcB family protein [unclassified Corynebacterium]
MKEVLKEMAVVGCGAALGALSRYAIGVYAASFVSLSPALITMGINIIACFLMGYLKPALFWGTGFLGGLSTFSTFIFVLAAHSTDLTFLGYYFFATPLLCISLWLLGDILHTKHPKHPRRRTHA